MNPLRALRMKSDYFICVENGQAIVTFRRRMPTFYRDLKKQMRKYGVDLKAFKILKSPRTADNWP